MSLCKYSIDHVVEFVLKHLPLLSVDLTSPLDGFQGKHRRQKLERWPNVNTLPWRFVRCGFKVENYWTKLMHWILSVIVYILLTPTFNR